MNEKNTLARITIDLPLDLQKKLKTISAINKLSMRAIVIESIETQLKKMNPKMDYDLLQQGR